MDFYFNCIWIYVSLESSDNFIKFDTKFESGSILNCIFLSTIMLLINWHAMIFALLINSLSLNKSKN